MAYNRRDVVDGITVMNKELYDNLQDGIDELRDDLEDLFVIEEVEDEE